MSATLYVVATPIGNLADITQRALSVLQQVNVIAAEDTRNTRKLLGFYGIDKPLLALHEHNELEKSHALISRLQAGDSVALVSDAGTPLISDPGYPLVRLCRENGLSVVPVPGANAAITALSVSGLPTDSFRFCGFPPRQPGKRRDFFSALAGDPSTLVFYEASHRIQSSLADAVGVFGGERQACLGREITKLFETFKTASLADIADFVDADENQRKGEFVLVVQGCPAQPGEQTTGIDIDGLLKNLVAVLPVKQAAAIVAEATGLKRNALYQRALDLKD